MYISLRYLENNLSSLQELNPFFGTVFLAFKQARLPVGSTKKIVFSRVVNQILDQYYRASSVSDRYYMPFQTSDVRRRWNAPRYGSTSLQRIAADTFRDVLLHEKRSPQWGWAEDYVNRLRHHLGAQRIPAISLAAWLYRDRKFPSGFEPSDLVSGFYEQFKITAEEQRVLFTPGVDSDGAAEKLWSRTQVSEESLLGFIGYPPGQDGAAAPVLTGLSLEDVSFVGSLDYRPGERLNLLLGDNGLGKTFLLDTLWWALVGNWPERPLDPRRYGASGSVSIGRPKIVVKTRERGSELADESQTFLFDRAHQLWSSGDDRPKHQDLAVYSRFDGSFAVWDPERFGSELPDPDSVSSLPLFLRRSEVWDGLPESGAPGAQNWICNGLIRDWVSWQSLEKHEKRFSSLMDCLAILFPFEDLPPSAGEPVRIPGEAREIPLIRVAERDIPLVYASAGVRRVVSLAYMLIWSWYEHLANCELKGTQSTERIVLLIDEVEAHLHPRWQRVVVPAILEVARGLIGEAASQLHISTHSPLVLASVEPEYDSNRDQLHHFKIDKGGIQLEPLPFFKRGQVDKWLMSEAFGLQLARSVEAEETISKAEQIQINPEVNPQMVRVIHEELVRYLAQDDEFWPRWLYFAERYGVDT